MMKIKENAQIANKKSYYLTYCIKVKFAVKNVGQEYIFKIVHSKKTWGIFLILSICYLSLQYIFKNEDLNSIFFFIYLFIIMLINSFMKEIVQIHKGE